jgi:hypothetical protein
VKPPIGVVATLAAPPGMQPPGLCGSGPINIMLVAVLGCGYIPEPKPILPTIDGHGALPFAGRSTNAPEPVAALPVIE